MGMTITEKIMSSHAHQDVHPGEIVWIDIDVRSARDFGGANVVKNFNHWYQGKDVEDVNKTFFTFDCVVPAKTIPYANNQHTCRIFAREKGIKVFDVNAGIGSHVMIREGLALPGTIIVGTDSHLNLLGAVGSFGQGMGDQDIAFAFKAGRTWFEVPETIKVTINGKIPDGCTPRDLTLFVVGKLGSKGALGKAVEFYGEAIDALDLSGRITENVIKRVGGEWGSKAAWDKTTGDLSGVATVYDGDWNLLVTGKNSGGNYKLWSLVYGDGGEVTAGTWSELKEIASAPSDGDFEYHRVFMDKPDAYRTFFIEKFTDTQSYNRPFWSHSLPDAKFIDNLWHEPV